MLPRYLQSFLLSVACGAVAAISTYEQCVTQCETYGPCQSALYDTVSGECHTWLCVIGKPGRVIPPTFKGYTKPGAFMYCPDHVPIPDPATPSSTVSPTPSPSSSQPPAQSSTHPTSSSSTLPHPPSSSSTSRTLPTGKPTDKPTGKPSHPQSESYSPTSPPCETESPPHYTKTRKPTKPTDHPSKPTKSHPPTVPSSSKSGPVTVPTGGASTNSGNLLGILCMALVVGVLA
jgi:hypothetical protein